MCAVDGVMVLHKMIVTDISIVSYRYRYPMLSGRLHSGEY